MQFKSLPWWLWLLPIALLVVAAWRLPYGYYALMRILACGFAGFFAFLSWEKERTTARAWFVAFVVVAVLFNPVLPIHFKRAAWSYLDLGAAVLFAMHVNAGVKLHRLAGVKVHHG